MNCSKVGIKKCHNPVKFGGFKDDLEKKVDV